MNHTKSKIKFTSPPRKSTHWCVKLPGEVYANDIRFEKPEDERAAREYMRQYLLGVKRLPNGTQFWPCTD